MSKTEPANTETVLIIGAYGLIGYGVARRLLADGHRVRGLGRTLKTARRVLPDLSWIIRDVSTLQDAEAWHPILQGISVVVNCSGALQDGPEDDLEAIHHHAVAALALACAANDTRLIQISAVGARPEAATPFLSSKARGDAAIRTSGARYQIFRPGLVIAPHSYGGTAMLRMLAAFPVFQPIAMPQARIQTVSLAEVAAAVSAATAGALPEDVEVDLVEAEVHTLRDVVSSIRHWLGFGVARRELVVPAFWARVLCRLADAVSLAGWRSPLRTTAFNVLTDGVTGKPTEPARIGLPPVSALSQTLKAMPARVEDRLFARMALLMPLVIAVLCLFWLASGVIGLARASEAARILEAAHWPRALALGSVVFWAVVDIAIGLAFAVRRFAPLACWAAVGVSVFYVLASTVAVPGLWLDPLGPLVKIMPGIVLALVARVVLDSR